MSSLAIPNELNLPVPYELHISKDLLALTKSKLKLARFPVELEDVADTDWSQGAKVAEVRRLADYWKESFDWRAQEAKINSTFNQFQVRVDTGTKHGVQMIHFAHHRSTQEDAIPLLFVAGWPGSFVEAQKLIEPLTSPPDSAKQSFHLVVASVPGFGPGEPPRRTAFGPATTAKAFKRVMVDVLGYERFVTQGGDLGASITRLMALQYPEHVRAYHLNFVPVRPPAWYKNPLAVGRFVLRSFLYSSEERQNLGDMERWMEQESAYGNMHRTKPQTLGFGLGDSPLGLLGWFTEKFHGWMDVENYHIPDDELLTLVMMHWMQGATPGFQFYKASVQEGASMEANGEKWTRQNAWTSYSSTPLGYSVFPKEIFRPPLDWVRSAANLSFCRVHDKGGHFASTEQPDLLVSDLREWFASDVVKQALRG